MRNSFDLESDNYTDTYKPYRELDPHEFQRSSVSNNNSFLTDGDSNSSYYLNDSNYVPATVRASRAIWITRFAIGAALFALLSVIFLFLSYQRCAGTWKLVIMLVALLGLVVALLTVFIGGMIQKAISDFKNENTFLTNGLLLASSFFSLFFFVTLIFLYIEKPYQFACIKCNYQIDSLDGFRDGTSMKDAWDATSWYRCFTAIFMVLTSIFFGAIAYYIWLVSNFAINHARSLMAFSGFLAIILLAFGYY